MAPSFRLWITVSGPALSRLPPALFAHARPAALEPPRGVASGVARCFAAIPDEARTRRHMYIYSMLHDAFLLCFVSVPDSVRPFVAGFPQPLIPPPFLFSPFPLFQEGFYGSGGREAEEWQRCASRVACTVLYNNNMLLDGLRPPSQPASLTKRLARFHHPFTKARVWPGARPLGVVHHPVSLRVPLAFSFPLSLDDARHVFGLALAHSTSFNTNSSLTVAILPRSPLHPGTCSAWRSPTRHCARAPAAAGARATTRRKGRAGTTPTSWQPCGRSR